MKTKILSLGAFALFAGSLFTSCKSTEENIISVPPVVVGQVVSDAAPLSGSIKGTMLSGKTYTLGGDITINATDTLLLQPGVTLKVGRGKTILVKGTFIWSRQNIH